MIPLYCTVCGKHLYNREGIFAPSEIVSPVGMTRPDGRPAVHGEALHWCGCPSPEKGLPSLKAGVL